MVVVTVVLFVMVEGGAVGIGGIGGGKIQVNTICH